MKQNAIKNYTFKNQFTKSLKHDSINIIISLEIRCLIIWQALIA